MSGLAIHGDPAAFFAVMAGGEARVERPDDILTPTQWRGLVIREGFEPHETFSASQLDLWDTCQYAWGLRYLWGLKEPEPVWGAPGLTPRQRSLAFGKALHARLEAYFRGHAVNWTDEVGQRALIGLAYLPSTPPAFPEGAIDGPRIAAAVLHMDQPVLFRGYKDLVTPEHLTDYKSTSSIKSWAKTPETLRADPAANLYALDDMIRLGLTKRECRWVYFASRDRPEAKPVDFTITWEGAAPIVRSMIIQGAGLRQEIRDRTGARHGVGPADLDYPDLQGLTKRLTSCKKYGGCVYHHTSGGPCLAERSGGPAAFADTIPASSLLDGLTQIRTKGSENHMPTLAERLAAASAAAPAQTAPPSGAPMQGFAPAPQAAQAFAPPPAFSTAPPAGFAPPAAPVPAAFMPPPGAPAPAFPGFGPPPGAPAPAFAPSPAPGQVNPPEAAMAFPPAPPPPAPMAAPPPAPVAEAAPARRPGRPRKAALPAALPGAPPPTADEGAEDLWTVVFRLERADGLVIQVPADPGIAEQVIATVVARAKSVIG